MILAIKMVGKNGLSIYTLKKKEETGRFIEKVVVKLHQSFPNPVVELKPPFELTRMGWGVFEIVMTLYFHAETKKHPMDITWDLTFQNGGAHKIVDLEF